MKVLALNSSPRKGKGNTQRILGPFMEGAREAGATTTEIYLYSRSIKPCRGCYSCWIKTPGHCVINDDAAEIFDEMNASDVVVFATPLYVFGMSAVMKLLLDRIMPSALPFIELVDGHSTHPMRGRTRTYGTVLISNCGFHELDNFKDLEAHFKTLTFHQQGKFIGSLLRPEGEFLLYAESFMPEKTKEIYDAAREAGRQAVTNGSISDKVAEAVSRPLLSLEQFVELANAYFKGEIEKNTA